ncbi:hypothetical protein [Streptomyces sp. NPDC006551]|uniref:hypothetical protein n=1 Tax=Streptomyces sp. NPDC006551 TaxID=3157178 RepID=UPI0033B6DE01
MSADPPRDPGAPRPASPSGPSRTEETVATVGLAPDRLDTTVAEPRAEGLSVTGFPADVTSSEAVEALIARV